MESVLLQSPTQTPPSFKPFHLTLQNGRSFRGLGPSYQSDLKAGEVVFTTGMAGYPETLTDPSYCGQIVTFTYPLIGNYGVPDKKYWESEKIHAKGVIVNELCEHWDHWQGTESLLQWLKKEKVPIITGIDTRAVTKTLRQEGTLLGAIHTEQSPPQSYQDPHNEHLVAQVSIKEKRTYGRGKKVIVALDCGMKENIVRSLINDNVTLHRVPYNYDFTHEPYDGLFISNGPGNPERCIETIPLIQSAFKKGKPIFGICLGTQLLALAAGAKTYKLPFGHRGHNQPCLEIESGRCFITSQNHGYAIKEDTLPDDWKVTFRNLNDQSIEGIAHKTHPFFAVQFHPEACPGPTDTAALFQQFYEML